MERIKTLSSRNLEASAVTGGCGECQTSCQSASKTSCSVANQQCEKCKESKQFLKFLNLKNRRRNCGDFTLIKYGWFYI